MKIGELARQTGVDTATIRYYERERLLPSPARTTAGYRSYGAQAVERLQFIRHCRHLDMPLADVRRLLALSGERSAPCEEVNGLIDAQLERVRMKRRELETLERQLAGLRARCRARRRVADCGIVGELMHAAHGEKCACHPGKASVAQPSSSSQFIDYDRSPKGNPLGHRKARIVGLCFPRASPIRR